MRKQNSTKRAWLASVLSLLLCVSMLIGTTFAWFTDTASTGVNTIQAGMLDIAFMMKEGDDWVTAEGETLKFANVDGETDILWEPGATFKLPTVKLVNNGNLALKFNMVVNGVYGDLELADVLDVMISVNGAEAVNAGTLSQFMADPDGAAHGVILPTGSEETDLAEDTTIGESAEYTIALHMQETAGNKYQGMSLGGMTFTAFASQYTYENDMTNDQYDKDALGVQEQKVLDLVADGYTKVTTADELKAAMTDGSKVVLANDIDLGNITASGLTVAKGSTVVIDLNGYAITAVDAVTSGNNEVIMNNGTLTIKDSVATGKITVSATTDRSWNALSAVISNLGTVNVEGGMLQHLGGTAMAYGIDMRSVTNNNIVTNITGGKVVSDYIGIRLFTNTTYTNDLTVSGGVVSGERLSVWIQSSSANDKAGVTVSGNGLLDGNFLQGHTGTNIKVNIPAANLNGEIE